MVRKIGIYCGIMMVMCSMVAADRHVILEDVHPMSRRQQLINAYGRGELFFSGQGVLRDLAQARECFTFVTTDAQAPEDLRLKAEYRLGEIAFSGDMAHGVMREYAVAKDHFLRVIESNNPIVALVRGKAALCVGMIYLSDDYNVQPNAQYAEQYFQLVVDDQHAAPKDKALAHYRLGELYYGGAHNVAKNFSSAVECFMAALSAQSDQGEPGLPGNLQKAAWCLVGKMYYSGDETLDSNRAAACSYFNQVYNVEHPVAITTLEEVEACYNQGRILMSNNVELIEQNYAQARSYFEAIVNSSDLPEHGMVFRLKASAYVHLGSIYEQGLGVERDSAKAVEYFETVKSAYPVFPADRVYACFALGMIYHDGWGGVASDHKKAFAAFKEIESDRYCPADKKVIAKYYCAKSYFYGDGVKKDIDKALLLFSSLGLYKDEAPSLSFNYTMAYYYIGRIYFEGSGNTKKNFLAAKMSLENLSLDAEAIPVYDRIYSSYMLGYILYYGSDNVQADRSKGIECLEKVKSAFEITSDFAVREQIKPLYEKACDILTRNECV